MKKSFFRFLLTQLIVLLSGCILLFAHTVQNGVYFSSVQNFVGQEYINADSVQDDNDLSDKSILDDAHKHQLELKAEVFELEEEDRSIKKYLKASSFPVSIIYARIFGHLFNSFNEIITPFHKSCHYAFTSRYIILQVFRL